MAAAESRRTRVLLLGESDLSHASLLRRLGERLSDLDVTIELIPDPTGIEARFVRNVRRLGHLDFQPLRWRLRYSLHAQRALASHADAVDVALVNTQSCALLSRSAMRRVPTVLSVDITGRQFAEMDYWDRGTRAGSVTERPLEALERRAYAEARRIVAWTEWTAQSLREDYDVDPCKITTLHFGIDLPDWSERAPRSEGPFRLLFVGNFSSRKGIDAVLAALALLGPNVELDLVTNDEVDEPAGVRVHRGVTQGSSKMQELFSAADAFILPTRADAVPWVIVEAMAAGLPVIATGVGAIPELVDDAGVLVPVGSARSIAEAVRRLADDPALCVELGRRGRRRAEARYDSRVQLPRLAEVLASASAS